MYINASLLVHGPPIMVVGSNSIGKTELIKNMAANFNGTFFTTTFEYGGYRQYEQQLKDHNIHNFVISDLQSITERSTQVRGNAIRVLSSLTSEGTINELVYTRGVVKDIMKKEKPYKANVILGATPNHVKQLIREQHHDLLVRFVYIFVERNQEEIDFSKPFELPIVPYKRIDIKKFEALQQQKPKKPISEMSPRETILWKKLNDALTVLQLKPQGKIKFYRPANKEGDLISLERQLTTASD